jgi:hypothetical protein
LVLPFPHFPIDFYVKVVYEDPEFAVSHFNLAGTLMKEANKASAVIVLVISTLRKDFLILTEASQE